MEKQSVMNNSNYMHIKSRTCSSDVELNENEIEEMMMETASNTI